MKPKINSQRELSHGTELTGINLKLINYNTTYTPKHYYRFETRTVKDTKHSLHTQSSLSTTKIKK